MKFLLNYLKSRLPILLAGLCIVTAAVTSLVYGKYVSDEPVAGTLDIIADGEIALFVTDNGDGTYTVANTDPANIPAYVRFTVVAVWVKDGMVWAENAVEGINYTVSGADCTKLTNYYYYNGICNPGEHFDIAVTPMESVSGMRLRVQVFVDGIQCLPEAVAAVAWGVTFDKNTSTWSVAP